MTRDLLRSTHVRAPSTRRSASPWPAPPSPSPSPARPARSATRCCSASPPASCSGRTCRCSCGCWRSRRRSRPPRAPRWSWTTARSRCWPASTSPTTRRRRSTASTWRCSSAPGRARPGMERGDLLEANGGIFKPQGEAINAGAADDIRVLVVGNPANTNALIARVARARRAEDRFTAMTRLDHNRALSQLAKKTGAPVSRHHQADDLGQPLGDAVPRHLPRRDRRQERAPRSSTTSAWLENDFIPTVAKRGAAIIEARGCVVGRVGGQRRDRPRLQLGQRHAEGDWTSAAIVSDGSYGVPEGLISSFPVTSSGGDWEIVQGLDDRRLLPRPHRRLGRPSWSRSATPSRASASSERRHPPAPPDVRSRSPPWRRSRWRTRSSSSTATR